MSIPSLSFECSRMPALDLLNIVHKMANEIYLPAEAAVILTSPLTATGQSCPDATKNLGLMLDTSIRDEGIGLQILTTGPICPFFNPVLFAFQDRFCWQHQIR